MSTSAFINALRRFIAIRGKFSEIRSDCGSNFIGATSKSENGTVNVEDCTIRHFLLDKGIKWIFNAPHSSHMGGSWERMIGVTRRILDAMLRDVSTKDITHDVLTTLMAFPDPDNPSLLSPATLLTQKQDHVTVSIDKLNTRDMYAKQWKHVQVLAELFWSRWRREYLQTLQPRRKWLHDVAA